MAFEDIGNKIDDALDCFVKKCERLGVWWSSTFPKWFRFIFFYATMIVWWPLVIVIAIPVFIVAGLFGLIARLWEDFGD